MNDALRQSAAKAITKHAQTAELLRLERQSIKSCKLQAIAAHEARQVVQTIAQTIQQHAHKHIARVVTKALQGVFDSSYEFKILFERKRGKTEARLVFVRDGIEMDPCSSQGNGPIEVAAFALRVACVMLSRPPMRRLIVLDEPFSRVSALRIDQIRSMIETLSRELQMQFVIVTHSESLECGKVIRLGE